MNQEEAVKEALKNITLGYLEKDASSFFISRCFKIIDESADSKESYMGAAARISKSIDLFIDRDMAQKVYDSIVAVIEKIDVPQGTKRRYRRVTFCKKVRVSSNGKQHELDSENLSEGGMYLRTEAPFPADSIMEITLPLEEGSSINLTGTVVYKKDPSGGTSKLPAGMAIEFKKVSEKETDMLRSYISKIPD